SSLFSSHSPCDNEFIAELAHLSRHRTKRITSSSKKSHPNGDDPGLSQHIQRTVQVEQSKVMIKQGGNQLTLTIVDAPDFGDAVDNSNTWQPIIYQTDRNGIYDITMTSAGINYIEFMKRLHDKVNVIPLIAKADTLTPEEYKDDDNKLVQKIKEKMPLAVVGSNVVIEVNSKKVRGRQYPWVPVSLIPISSSLQSRYGS
uniref:Septin-type G domain-containing protein n=1 Tax=Oreochromis niloticus TaxID=8128 RepID=A0A669E521_ORENI